MKMRKYDFSARAYGIGALFLILFLLASTLFGAGAVHAQSQTVIFALFSRGWPPFEMVIDGTCQGAAPQILEAVLPDDVSMTTIPYPAARKYLYPTEGLIHTRLEAEEWMPPGYDLLWSAPVMKSRNVLYSPAQRPLVYRGLDSLEDTIIGCIKNYRYPAIQPLFDAGRAERYNVNGMQLLMRMLKAGRIDAAVVDEMTAAWFIAQQPELSPNDFHVAEQAVDSVDLRFVFNNIPEWEPRLPELNDNIARAREDGTIDQILNQYR